MKHLNHVKQLDRLGCSLACLAMVTGKSYFAVREVAHQYVPRLKNICIEPNYIGLYPMEMLALLKAEPFNISSQFIRFISLGRLQRHCILSLCPLNGDHLHTHAVVYDAVARCLIEPSGKPLDFKLYNVFLLS